MAKKLTKTGDIITNVLLIICLGIFGYSSYRIFDYEIGRRAQNKEHDKVNTIIEEIVKTEDEKWTFNKEAYTKLKNENPDFQAFLRFDSEIISEPVLLSYDNDYYLRKDFYGNYSSMGIPFMDYRCNLDSDNIVIYGHLIYDDPNRMFSPLTLLTTQEGYEANKTFKLYLPNEIRSYEIEKVFYYLLDDYESYDYVVPTFIDEYQLNNFLQYPNTRNVITGANEIVFGDHMITLQTCVVNHDEQRLVCMAKEIAREPYPEEVVQNEDQHIVEDGGQEVEENNEVNP